MIEHDNLKQDVALQGHRLTSVESAMDQHLQQSEVMLEKIWGELKTINEAIHIHNASLTEFRLSLTKEFHEKFASMEYVKLLEQMVAARVANAEKSISDELKSFKDTIRTSIIIVAAIGGFIAWLVTYVIK